MDPVDAVAHLDNHAGHLMAHHQRITGDAALSDSGPSIRATDCRSPDFD
jgi:hypothetical protein